MLLDSKQPSRRILTLGRVRTTSRLDATFENLDEFRVIRFAISERLADRVEIHPPSVRGDLNALRRSRLQIEHERISRFLTAITGDPRDEQLRIRIERRPRP